VYFVLQEQDQNQQVFFATLSGHTICPGVPVIGTSTCMPINFQPINGCPAYLVTGVAGFPPGGRFSDWRLTHRIITDPFLTLNITAIGLFFPFINYAYFHGTLTTIDCTGAVFTNIFTPGRCGTTATEIGTAFTVGATGGTVTISPGCP